MVKYMHKSNIAFKCNSKEIKKKRKRNKLDEKDLLFIINFYTFLFNKLIILIRINRLNKLAIKFVD